MLFIKKKGVFLSFFSKRLFLFIYFFDRLINSINRRTASSHAAREQEQPIRYDCRFRMVEYCARDFLANDYPHQVALVYFDGSIGYESYRVVRWRRYQLSTAAGSPAGGSYYKSNSAHDVVALLIASRQQAIGQQRWFVIAIANFNFRE